METTELLKRSELTKRTLRKYVGLGLIKRPQVEHHGPGSCTSHYPDDSLTLIELIKGLKAKGKTLSEIQAILPKAVLAKEAREQLEAKHGKIERNLEPEPERWLQLSIELMLLETGVSTDEISDRLIVGLNKIRVERGEDGEIHAIRIEKDPQAISKLESLTAELLQL